MKTPEELAREWKNEYIENPQEVTEAHGHLLEAFLAGYAAANRWISVEEELPNDGEIILVQYKSAVKCAEYNIINNQSSWCIWDCPRTIDAEVFKDYIKYWQPLPPLPNK